MRNVCEAMKKDMVEGGTSESGERDSIALTLGDIPGLLELVVCGRHQWEEIGIALGLPEDEREDCRSSSRKNHIRLTSVLETWIKGNYEGAKTATLDNLRKALSSGLVALHNLSLKLSAFQKKADPVLEIHLHGAPIAPEICLQSYNTKVAEGKSTLLEVQVSCGGCKYQWSKDGQPLLERDNFSGMCSSFLYISEASLGTEGKYCCSISKGSSTVNSKEINLKVIYPPEKEHLMNLYSPIEREVPKDSWPPRGTSTFINLVLIRQSRKSKLDYYTVRGDVDDILESKEIVKYEEVFREYRERALVLVEGRPGSGKTTLVNKLARDWATGVKILLGAKQVFLITLRFLNFSGKDKSLSEILEVFYDDEELTKKIEVSLRECGGRGACFIIDGLDEYEHKNMQQSVINQLISKKCLPFSMVIVASRPVATDKLKESCARRIEVLGFTKSQIKEYVESYPFSDFSDVSDMASRLIKYLDQHPNILHMCYLPVHAAMICFLFSKLKDNIPHTETQIYKEFIIATLLRQKIRNKEHQICTEGNQRLKSLKDLRGKERRDFKIICELAYNMTMKSQQVVSQSDSSVSLSDLSSSVVSLLTVEQAPEIHGVEVLYTFLHLTCQEYLAAFHIVELEEHEQLITLISNQEDQMKNVRKFCCGLLGLERSKLLADTTFLQSLFPYDSNSEYLSLSFVQCAFESQNVEVCDYLLKNFNFSFAKEFFSSSDFMALGYVIAVSSVCISKIHFWNCTWDYEGSMAFSLMDKLDKLRSIKHLTICGFIRYRDLNGLLTQVPCLEVLDLQESKLNLCCIEELTKGITLAQLSVLKIGVPMIPCSNPEEVLKLLTFGSDRLEQVYAEFVDDCLDVALFTLKDHVYIDELHANKYVMWRKWLCCAFGSQVFVDSDFSWLHLYNSKPLSSCQQRFPYCTEVVLVNCCIDNEGAEVLANTLNTSILENVVLDFNRVSDSGAVAIARCMAKCSVVQKVSIQCNSIGDLGAKELAGKLVYCESLSILDLQGNTLGDEGAMAIAEAAEGLLNLVIYLHNVNITDCVVKILERRSNTSIKSMVFNSSWDGICDAGIDAMRRALKCGMLPALKISRNNIFNLETLVRELELLRDIKELVCDLIIEDAVPTLCAIMNSMSNLQYYSCTMTRQRSSTSQQLLFSSLRMCGSLVSLSLSGIEYSLSNDQLEAIKCRTNLQSLELRCNLHSEAVASLFSDHKSWTNLRTLALDTCEIGWIGCQVLRDIFCHCENLYFLDLSYNSVGDGGCFCLAEGLQNHTTLLVLKLEYNYITSSGIAALRPVIRRNRLQHLDFSFNELDSVDFLEDIHEGNLQTLDVGRCGLGSDGAVELGVRLKNFKHLLNLDVSYNKIGTCGMSALAEGLQCCKNLQALNVSGNEITSDGIAAIVSIMRSCRYLQRLDFSFHKISIDDAAALVVGWQHKSTLRLYVHGCFDEFHEISLLVGQTCCRSCYHLLELYDENDYILIMLSDRYIPKLVSYS